MTRTELIEMVADYAGPLGPLREPLEQTARFRAELERAEAADFERLLELLTHVPPEATLEHWDIALEEALAVVGRRDPLAALQRLVPLLWRPHRYRSLVIGVVGELGHDDGVEALVEALSTEQLDTEELVAVACALGELGGASAQAALLQMRKTFADAAEVAAEVDIALQRRRAPSPAR